MLSRTASELYWLSRYMERAENTARMLDVAFAVTMMPDPEVSKEELIAPMRISGNYAVFQESGKPVNRQEVLRFFATDKANPTSVLNCFDQARDNAKSVRSKLSSETWEAINSSWIELQKMRRSGKVKDASLFLDWVKERSHLFRGAVYGTSMRGDAYRFLRLGTFIERADNTARILDTKSQSDTDRDDSTTVEYFRWSAMLKSLGAFEAYQELHGDRITAATVAELMILHPSIPRSLHSCLQAIDQILSEIEGDEGLEAKRLTAVQYARIQYADRAHIFSEIGLHEYLTDFLARVGAIAESIQSAYMEAV